MFLLYLNCDSKLNSFVKLFSIEEPAWPNRFLYFWLLKWHVSARRFLIHRFLLAGVYCTCNDHKILLVYHVLTHVIFKVPFFCLLSQYLQNILLKKITKKRKKLRDKEQKLIELTLCFASLRWLKKKPLIKGIMRRKWYIMYQKVTHMQYMYNK